MFLSDKLKEWGDIRLEMGLGIYLSALRTSVTLGQHGIAKL